MYDTHTPAEWLEVLAASAVFTTAWFAPVLALDHRFPRDAALTVAVFLMLLSHAPEGAR